jgi:uncharacterized protein (DUF488 family)
MRIATIGVYGWTLESFLAALHVANVRVVLDVRRTVLRRCSASSVILRPAIAR